ncbi:hypothetical protein RCL1_006988 [Eukaryota sp. TZLM3-RCL]
MQLQLHHLCDGEFYLQEFFARINNVESSLKLCTFSLYFQLCNSTIYRIPFKHFCGLEVDSSGTELSFTVSQYIQIKSSQPYTTINTLTEFKVKPKLVSARSLLSTFQTFITAQSLSYTERSLCISNFLEELVNSKPFDPSLLRSITESILLQTRSKCLSSVASNPGHLVLTSDRVYFAELNDFSAWPVKYFEYPKIKSISIRTYSIDFPSLELFFSSSKDVYGYQDYLNSETSPSFPSMYFIFDDVVTRNAVLEHLGSKVNVQELITDVSKLPSIISDWQAKKVSNYELLLKLNDISGRSFKDLTSYPIFPWILTDYTSSSIDISDHSVYRDLSKPVGALNQNRLKNFKKRYSDMLGIFESEFGFTPLPGHYLPSSFPLSQILQVPMLYGCHYSTAGYVLFYLLRDVPELVLRFQNGHFDSADRCFHSIAETFDHVISSNTDVKELIPQFYDPQSVSFLSNKKSIKFDCRHDGQSIDDVILPPWATSPQHFIDTLRRALESDHVSSQLNDWIDLIFGYKQSGMPAIQADNVFHHLSYRNAVDFSRTTSSLERLSLTQQATEFGQTPNQILRLPCPKRSNQMSIEELKMIVNQSSTVDYVISSIIEISQSSLIATPFLEEDTQSSNLIDSVVIEPLFDPIMTHKSGISALTIVQKSDLDVQNLESKFVIVASNDGCLRTYTVDSDPQSITIPLSRLSLTDVVPFRHFNDDYAIISSREDSLFLFSLSQNKVVSSYENLADAVSNVGLIDVDDDVIVVVSLWNCSVELFKFNKLMKFEPILVLSDHDDEISALFVSKLQSKVVILSSSVDCKLIASTIQDHSVADFDLPSVAVAIQKFKNDTFLIVLDSGVILGLKLLINDDFYEFSLIFETQLDSNFTSACFFHDFDLICIGDDKGTVKFVNDRGNVLCSHSLQLNDKITSCDTKGNLLVIGFEQGQFAIVKVFAQ